MSPIMIPPVSPTGILQYAWIDPGGTTRDLTYQTSPRLFVSRGSAGLGGPSVEMASDKLPFAAGTLVRHIQTREGRIELPITIHEDSIGDLIGVLDDLRGWFDTGDEETRTPGYLRITRPDGSVRQVACYYAGGLEGDMARGGPNWCTYVVSLLAPDPWPTDLDDTVLTYGEADFGSEQIVINQGQLDAYPIWTILGPVDAGTPSIRVEKTTGELFSFNFDLLNHGIGVIVDTRRGDQRETVSIRRYPDDLNLFAFVNAAATLWRLSPGENRFQLDLEGATSETSVELRYRARYRGLMR